MSLRINTFSTAGDWQRPYLWLFEVVNTPVAMPAGVKLPDQDIYLVKGKIPKRAQELITIKWGGEYANYAGAVIKSEKTVLWTLRCDRKWQAWQFFKTWHDLSGNEEIGASVTRPLYTGSIKVSLLDVDKSTQLASFLFTQVFFPEGFELDLDREKDAEVTTFEILMAFDKIVPTINVNTSPVDTAPVI